MMQKTALTSATAWVKVESEKVAKNAVGGGGGAGGIQSETGSSVSAAGLAEILWEQLASWLDATFGEGTASSLFGLEAAPVVPKTKEEVKAVVKESLEAKRAKEKEAQAHARAKNKAVKEEKKARKKLERVQRKGLEEQHEDHQAALAQLKASCCQLKPWSGTAVTPGSELNESDCDIV